MKANEISNELQEQIDTISKSDDISLINNDTFSKEISKELNILKDKYDNELEQIANKEQYENKLEKQFNSTLNNINDFVSMMEIIEPNVNKTINDLDVVEHEQMNVIEELKKFDLFLDEKLSKLGKTYGNDDEKGNDKDYEDKESILNKIEERNEMLMQLMKVNCSNVKMIGMHGDGVKVIKGGDERSLKFTVKESLGKVQEMYQKEVDVVKGLFCEGDKLLK
jgi:hypothetical protein